MRRFLFAILFLLLFSCEATNISLEVELSDTTKVINQAILMGVDVRDMPSADGLKARTRFGDTILLTSQILPLSVLPKQVGSEKFKVMPQKELCATMKAYEDLEPTPKYLNVSRFEKNDSGYYIQLQSISCGEFGGGGALGIYFKKKADSFVVVNRQASSIN